MILGLQWGCLCLSCVETGGGAKDTIENKAMSRVKKRSIKSILKKIIRIL
jgi:hypothetical protein